MSKQVPQVLTLPTAFRSAHSALPYVGSVWLDLLVNIQKGGYHVQIKHHI